MIANITATHHRSIFLAVTLIAVIVAVGLTQAQSPSSTETKPVATRIYDVRDLITYIPDPETEKPDEVKAREKDMVESLVKLIQEQVVPDSWRDNGGTFGSINLRDGQMIISQTPVNHNKIMVLLDALREARGLQITVECQFIGLDPSAIPKFLQQSFGNSQLPCAFLDDEQVNELIKSAHKLPAASLATLPRFTVWNGYNAKVTQVETQNCVSAYTVGKDAKGQPEYRPVISKVEEGLTLYIRALLSADRKYVTLILHPQLSQVVSMETVPWSDNAATGQNLTVQKPKIETCEMTTAGMVPDKGTFLLGGLVEVRSEGGSMLIRRATSTTAPAGNVGAKADGGWRPIYLLVKPTIIIETSKLPQFPSMQLTPAPK